jgi:hypothetical protein
MSKTGFVIANQHEEFLVSFKEKPGCTLTVWGGSPEQAKVFKTRFQVIQTMKKIGTEKYSLWLLSYSDVGEQIEIGCDDDTLPPWFRKL